MTIKVEYVKHGEDVDTIKEVEVKGNGLFPNCKIMEILEEGLREYIERNMEIDYIELIGVTTADYDVEECTFGNGNIVFEVADKKYTFEAFEEKER